MNKSGKTLISDVVVSLILVALIVSSMLAFGGGITSKYGQPIDAQTNASIQNIEDQSSGITATASNIYEASLNNTNDEVGLLGGATIWVGSSITAITTAMGSISQIENIGGTLIMALGISGAIASIILLAIITKLIFVFIGIMLGRDRV